ncbi:MAG: hypothetical protein N0A16_10955 [Blastocatellia bacterium]|nr:hypothetical protein [Blastocatellia bacterium]MCS7158234.1 hypothetical protein [Blastocatellia bacterium]MCX7753072.1 hypothetical protein [Blastocatellia bacterium]MDW8169388.1 hypothetical protein [Acidobacteriota bacterium]MDW8256455.1 hypothetical protein [Acidobacteriota bacterium]
MSEFNSFKPDAVSEERAFLERSSGQGERSRPADDFVVNYFNYFTEVEEHFARRRGKHLLLSTLDWAMIETWKDMGIPLHVVLRAVDRVFDAYEARPRARRINSILYCQQEVMACFEEYRHSRIGAREESDGTPASPPPFSREMVLDYLERGRADLERLAQGHCDPEMAPLREAIGRVIGRLEALLDDVRAAQEVDFEALERELVRLEQILYEALLSSLSEERVSEVQTEGERQLREYKKRMPPDLYEQTLRNYVAKRLREQYGLPRLSLFYL